MDAILSSFPSWFGIVIIIIGLLWAFMWFLVPFAIYSIYKSSIRQVEVQELTLEELKKLNRGIELILQD